LSRHHATYQNPYGERVLGRCFWPVVFKKGGFKFWAVFTEKYGMPWLVGKVPRATNETERAALLTRLVSMVQDAVAVINDDESVEINEAGDKRGSADIYEKLISASNREISKAILGQTLSTELDKGGSYAATEGHLEVREDIVEMDRSMVKTGFNLFFKWITDLNFAAGAIAPEFGFYEEEDIQKDLAERDKTLTDQGVRFTQEYYQRAYNLEEGDFTLGEPRVAGIPGQSFDPAQDRRFVQFVKQGPGASNLSPADTLDGLGRKLAASARIDGLMAPIEDLLSQVSTLDEFRDRLIETYDHMDADKLGELMAKAFALAELSGRFDAAKR
jgi:phage gp29-like protein